MTHEIIVYGRRHFDVFLQELHRKNLQMDKQYFFLKLVPPRSTFGSDMTFEERLVMEQHIAYWLPYINEGTIIVQGPVFDPAGIYGIAVAAVDSREYLEHLIANDPANGMSTYELYPMSAALKRE